MNEAGVWMKGGRVLSQKLEMITLLKLVIVSSYKNPNATGAFL